MLRPHRLRREGDDIPSVASGERQERAATDWDRRRRAAPDLRVLPFLIPLLPSLSADTVRYGRRRSKSGWNSPNQRYRLVAGGPHTDLLANQYVPPSTSGTIRYCRPYIGGIIDKAPHNPANNL
ncbi:hypothetical protein BHM03_00004043 [Ensete ventricosum]|nr:hypothetical protein BHM03_00004043 [Ensete ventricosum]